MPTPLHDHFRPPLSTRRHWHAFHNAWATYLASDLNARLPDGFFAEPNVQFGIEIDVAAFDEGPGSAVAPLDPSGGWTPPEPVLTVPFAAATETVEVLVYDSREGPVLAAAVELVSPANKDRRAHREAFVAKCQTYLQCGAGLAMVDIVTDRKANLHADLLAEIDPSAEALRSDLYAVAYRPVDRDGATSLEMWPSALEVGHGLPSIPLWLRGGPCLPLDLAATYDRTCREQRIPIAAAAT